MKIIFIALAFFSEISFAAPSRTVQMKEGEMTPVYVSPRFSTILQFDAHPEPGLIGDQDAFKVEYMRNLVAIKPLMSRGKTNLFIFTKEGQFNFQLISSNDHHDNIVYVKRAGNNGPEKLLTTERIVMIDDLITRWLNKVVKSKNAKLTIESVATPKSKSTLVIKFELERKQIGKEELFKIAKENVLIKQKTTSLSIENIYLENSRPEKALYRTKGLLLLRAESIAPTTPLDFSLDLGKNDVLTLQIKADFLKR